MKVLVIGGGASGMMAALTAAEDSENQVTLLERQSRVGRKLLATGNGRCNLTNLNAGPDRYHGQNPAFVRHALEQFSVEDTLAFFRSLGLLTTAEASGRVYPFSDQANSVVDVLRFALERRGVAVRCGCEVLSLGKKARGYSVKTAGEAFYGDKVIVACGGAAGGKLGGTDLGYRLLKSMGHSMTELRPSLVQLKTGSATRALKGVRADAGLTLKRDGSAVATTAGEVQFTEFGVSGPAAFEVSREAARGGGLVLLLDLLRPWSEMEVLALLAQKRQSAPEQPLEDFLTGMVHNRLGRVALTAAGLDLTRQAGSLPDQALAELARSLKHFALPVTGVLGLDQAQVTAGGILTAEFRPDTLESRLCPGLFAAGEVLDIDGDCGGFNLQWAWSSGRIAGKLGKIIEN